MAVESNVATPKVAAGPNSSSVFAAMMRKGSTSPVTSLSSADSFNHSNGEGYPPQAEQHEGASQGAVLNSLTFENIEEYNRLKEIKLKKLHIQTGLSKETKN